MVNLNLIPALVHGEEEGLYCNTHAFIGDTVRLFLVNSDYVDGVLTGIDQSFAYINNNPIDLSTIKAFNVYGRGFTYRSLTLS